jgi:hypothetical protein
MSGAVRSQDELKKVAEAFRIYGDFVKATPYGSGHINDTFALVMDQAGYAIRYILQRINDRVFREPVKLMDNVSRICTELHKRLDAEDVRDASRRALTVIPALDGAPCVIDGEGSVWRLYLFVEDAVGYDIVENTTQAYEAARAFGEFQKLLTALPGERLNETIPGFHDTPARFRRFREVVQADPEGLVSTAGPEIDFYLSYEQEVGRLVDLHARGLIPERVTHNDTKLNNVLIDSESHKAMCVIDLDTSMPGLAAYDFGDLVRTSTVSAAEDETDLSLINVRKDMFQALAKGYLSSAAGFLTDGERDNLFFGGKLMTYEVGMRFLTDYLEGNPYFKTRYAEHNLVRCRTQLTIVRELEKYRNELEDFVSAEYEACLAAG